MASQEENQKCQIPLKLEPKWLRLAGRRRLVVVALLRMPPVLSCRRRTPPHATCVVWSSSHSSACHLCCLVVVALPQKGCHPNKPPSSPVPPVLFRHHVLLPRVFPRPPSPSFPSFRSWHDLILHSQGPNFPNLQSRLLFPPLPHSPASKHDPVLPVPP